MKKNFLKGCMFSVYIEQIFVGDVEQHLKFFIQNVNVLKHSI